MIYFTLIARVVDGLPLAATIQEDDKTPKITSERGGISLHKTKKSIVFHCDRPYTVENLPSITVIDSEIASAGVLSFHTTMSDYEIKTLSRHIVEYQNQAKQLVCRMTPTSPSRCSLVAGSYVFHYLLDRGVCYLILTEADFSRTKAFAFLEAIQTQFFSEYSAKINTVSRPYAFLDFDAFIRKTQKTYTDSRSSNVSQLNVALQDVQRIMVQNIDDVLQRGEALSALDARATNLSSMSKKYRQDAATLNAQSAWVFYVVLVIVILAVFTYVYFRYM